MTTNDSAPNVPTPIDPASQIALAALARCFDDRHADNEAKAQDLRADFPIEFSEQHSIAYVWHCAANMTWDLLGGRPDADKYVRRVHTVEMDLRELGRLIAMATASNPERIAELEAQVADRERAIERYCDGVNVHLEKMSKANARIAELEARSPANECSDAERTQYEVTIERIQGVTVKAHQALDKYGIQAWGDDHQLELHERIELTIAQQQKRIAELETSTKQAWRERDYFQSRANEEPTKALVMRLEAERDHARTEARDLQARIAELTRVPVVDGAATLQRVRDKIEKTRIESFAARQETLVQYTANAAYLYAIEAIDAELAALAPAK